MQLWIALVIAFAAAVAGALCAKNARKRESRPFFIISVLCALICFVLVVYTALTLIFTSAVK